MPWIIADYESETLDLNDPRTFRDLSKPVGALAPKRLAAFRERMEALRGGDIKPFLYGSHYSNAGFVLYYLLRLQPFTSLALNLQVRTLGVVGSVLHPLYESASPHREETSTALIASSSRFKQRGTASQAA